MDPLGLTSYHPRFVHREWPKYQVQRTRVRCRSKLDVKAAFISFAKKLCSISGNLVDTEAQPKSILSSTQEVFSRLIIPWRLEWEKARLGSLLADLQALSNSVLRDAALDVTSVGVSWSLSGRHLVQRLVKSNGT